MARSLNHRRAVRLMAGIAELTAGMFLGVDLRKAPGLSDVFGMAADAERGDFGQFRFCARGVVGMLRKRAVAGFAVDVGVDAFCLGLGDIGVAAFAGVMAGVGDRARGDFADGIAAKMAVAAEAVWDERTAENEEKNQADDEDRSHAKEMGNVLQLDHKCACPPQKLIERSFIICRGTQNYRAWVTHPYDGGHEEGSNQ